MATKILSGEDNIQYTCINIKQKDYGRMIADKPHTSIIGIVNNGLYHPSEDFSIECKNHWSLPILESYKDKTWVIIENHPSNIYAIRDTNQEDTFNHIEYDMWLTENNIYVAIATNRDID